MTECGYCYTDVGEGRDSHRECDLEMRHRLRSRVCVRCGKKPFTLSAAVCKSCNADSLFAGYPGGST